MATLIYMPLPSDSDETVVGGVRFRAYEPVQLDDFLKSSLINKLRRNPWFASGEIDRERNHRERHQAWNNARLALAEAKKHRARADKLERELTV